jgi:hypothetical protein
MKLEKDIPNENLCPNTPARDGLADAWHQRRVLIRRELRRHQINDSALRVAEIILDMSLGQGLERVVIPNLDCFSELTGIGRPHVSEAISALREMRILRVSSVDGAPTYQIREDPDSDGLSPFNWRVQPRMTLREMERAVDTIREWNRLPPLPHGRNLGAIANFKNRPVNKKTRAAVPKNGIPVGTRNGLPEEQIRLF